MSGFFQQNCILKWMIFFASICCLWDLLPEILQLVEVFNHLFSSSKFSFLGTFLAHFSHCNFMIFGRHFYPASPHILHLKKFPAVLSKYVWKLKDTNISSAIEWSIVTKLLSKTQLNFCKLCLIKIIAQ